MKIGITAEVSQNIWASGEAQYIYFLYDILRRANFDCFFLHSEERVCRALRRYKQVNITNAISQRMALDVLIIGSLFPSYVEIASILKENPRCKIIYFNFNSLLVEHTHGFLASTPSAPSPPQLLDLAFLLDEIWVFPHTSHQAPYIEALFNTEKVREAPYIWDSQFISRTFSKDGCRDIRYDPAASSDLSDLRQVCIFEPNVNFAKNFLIPLAICERTINMESTALESINIFNCKNLRMRQYFKVLVESFKAVKEKKVYFNNRWNLPAALQRWGGSVVSHQHLSELNYLYLECLYLGIPLIHNSKILQDYGYFYKSFDVKEGSRMLKLAINCHKDNFDYYQGQATHCLSKYSTYNPLNVESYKSLVNSLK